MRRRGLLLVGLACLAATAPAAPPQPVTVVAHRGLADGMPENTLAAFRHSIERGHSSIIELDIRTTRDGELVILHDETLDRTTDCTGVLSKLEFVRIKSCDAGWPSHPGERIPTLSQVLDFARHRPTRLLLDIKPGTSVRRVIATVRQYRAEAKVILGLRRIGDITNVQTAAPRITKLAFIPALADAGGFAAAGADIIRLWSDWVEAEPEIVARTRNLGSKVWIMVGRKLPKRNDDWRALHARMMSAGADGLITNRPELMSAP